VTAAAARSGRIVILGCPGSGKTTLARRLQARTGLPLYHLDDEYWGPRWSRTPEDAWRRRQMELTSGARWIIEGNYFDTIEVRATRADLVVILDAPALVCLWRVLMRAFRIHRGATELLPRRVGAAAKGGETRPTKDFSRLVSLILRFHRATWWPLIDKARTRHEARLVIAAAGGRFPQLRAQLAERKIFAEVLAAEHIEDYVADWLRGRG
jgi:hypothetical protein